MGVMLSIINYFGENQRSQRSDCFYHIILNEQSYANIVNLLIIQLAVTVSLALILRLILY